MAVRAILSAWFDRLEERFSYSFYCTLAVPFLLLTCIALTFLQQKSGPNKSTLYECSQRKCFSFLSSASLAGGTSFLHCDLLPVEDDHGKIQKLVKFFQEKNWVSNVFSVFIETWRSGKAWKS